MIQLTAKLDEKAMAAYFKRLDKNRGKPLLYRAEKTTHAAARLVVPRLRAGLPASGRSTRPRQGPIAIIGAKRRRTMRSMAKAKLLKKRGSEAIRPTWIGVGHFAFRWLTEGTQGHSLATRDLEAGARGRWTTRGNWRSGFAHFADNEVRPLAGITVRGVTGRDYISPAWDATQGQVVALIKRDVFSVR